MADEDGRDGAEKAAGDAANAVLTLRPIGVVRTPFREKREAPRQPRAAEGVRGTIELFPGRGFEDALADVAGWEYLWVLFWFHDAEGWRPKVLPPRSTTRRGLFSTRAPHRPNPLGMSVVKLESVSGLTLAVRDVDMLDGTPVLDLKPYVAWADAIPNAREGWLDDERAALDAAARGEGGEGGEGRPADPRGEYEVRFSPRALEQLAFLREHGIALEEPVRAALALGPQPHAYRRIRVAEDGTGRLALKEWRAVFRTVEPRALEVLALASGYRPRELTGTESALEAHRAFARRWGHA